MIFFSGVGADKRPTVNGTVFQADFLFRSELSTASSPQPISNTSDVSNNNVINSSDGELIVVVDTNVFLNNLPICRVRLSITSYFMLRIRFKFNSDTEQKEHFAHFARVNNL